MKTSFVCCIAISLTLSAAIQAQTATSPNTKSEGQEDALYRMSPFVVSTAQDTGYAPTESLSGSRLKTPIRDIPSAQSILTAEILSDLGAGSFLDVVDYLPSTSSYQSEGDWTGVGRQLGGYFTVRGFASADHTTNFFGALAPTDTYNTGRFTFSRGPNQLLFGSGAPGGGVDIVTNRTNLKNDSQSLSLRADSFGSIRVSTDSNFAVMPGKFGLRVNLLRDKKLTYIENDRQDRTSAYGALGFRPFTGTLITLMAEGSQIRQKLPAPYVVFDQYTPWVLAGRPTVAGYGNRFPTSGLEFNNPNGYIVIIEGQNSIPAMDWAASALGAHWKTAKGANITTVSFAGDDIVPVNVNAKAGAVLTQRDNSNGSIIIEQQVGKNLLLELGAKTEHQYTYFFTGLLGTDLDFAIKADANERLPNGQPNPYVGMPYIETAQPSFQALSVQNDEVRFSTSYDLNLDRLQLFGRKLGTLRFAGLVGRRRGDTLYNNESEVNLTPLRTTGTFGDLNNAVNAIHRRYYFTPSSNSYFTSTWNPAEEVNGIKAGYARARTPQRDIVERRNYNALVGQASLLQNLLSITAGVRRDTVTQTTKSYPATKGVFADLGQGIDNPPLDSVGETYSYGAVLHLGKNIDMFANTSSNFTPLNSSQVQINGELQPPMEGVGDDVGFRLYLLGNKIQGSVVRFTTRQENATDFQIKAGIKTSAVDTIWDAIDSNKKPPVQWIATMATETEGYEFQLVANPTKNLRVMLTGSKNTTKIIDRARSFFDYIEQNRATWLANASLPVTHPSGNTVGALLTALDQEIANNKRLIGIRQTLDSQWRASAIGRYAFDSTTWLKGFAVGGAFRWQDEPVIGYKLLPSSTLFDINNPFFGAQKTNLDLWIDYSRRISNRIMWKLQLRVMNVADNRELTPRQAIDDGNGGRFVQTRLMPNARSFQIQSDFSF